MRYDHTQTGSIHNILLASSVFVIAVGIVCLLNQPNQHEVALIVMIMGGLSLPLGHLFFKHLRVYDDGEFLQAWFGPVRSFGTKVKYDEIKNVEVGKTNFFEGIGLHYTPFYGKIINVAMGDCVKITLNNDKFVKVGTDEPVALKQFIDEVISSSN